MNELLSKGEIIEVFKFNNHLYGLTLENIEDVAQKGKFCILTFGLEVRILIISGGR
jgi:guanylate kinase